MNRKKILAISGSTRINSINSAYIKALSELYADRLEIFVYKDLSGLPHFNPDHDIEPAPEAVADLRKQLRAADGVLICTPEYAMGVPGTLKNAIDWTVSSCEFSHKPVMLITAASMGEKAHESLLGTLKIIEANVAETNLLIPYAKTKISTDTKITDAETLGKIKEIMRIFIETIGK
ncbi:MAG: NADPH-dependent reductase [Bacteroidetes bacterium]|nr:NADPH-dependent reductase [Bacteroidota bacterium]